MGTEDFIDHHASGSGSENNELHNSYTEQSEADSLPSSLQVEENIFNRERLGKVEGDGGNEECPPVQEMDVEKDLVKKPTDLRENVELTGAVVMTEITRINSGVNSKNGCLITQIGSTVSKHRIDDSPISLSGVKRARMTHDDPQPSVHVIYNSLTRDGKRKLEELLQQWSEWHAQHKFSSNDSNEALESGEETYFPAISVGLEKSSTVAFRIDNQARNHQKEFIPIDGDTVPLYDRGYTLVLSSMEGSTNPERGLETFEASRCFNCGSYNHSLKECPKPRDNAAVNNARKQHNSKRNQTAGPRNAARYYQNTPGGKYDGVKPGILGAETRQILGLGELDPPPWLYRMREMGYPPGYLDPEEDDQPSGIKIYADEETKEDQEDGEILGEILETEDPEQIALNPEKKMIVEFPGINAPIPENADEKRWAASPRASSFDSSRSRLHQRLNRSSDGTSKGHSRDQRWSRDYGDDGPPGCDPAVSPIMSGHLPRYSGYDLNYTNESHSPRGIPIPRSPSLGRSLSDRGRRSPLVHEGSPSHSPYSSLPYLSPNTRQSPPNYNSPSIENWTYESQHNSTEESRVNRCNQFLNIFEQEGCRMVEMSCAEHDRHAAGTQFITHTIARALEKLRLESTPISTKGYETLLELIENTARDSFELYYGLFMYNKNALEQLERLDMAFESVKKQLFGQLHDVLRKQLFESAESLEISREKPMLPELSENSAAVKQLNLETDKEKPLLPELPENGAAVQ